MTKLNILKRPTNLVIGIDTVVREEIQTQISDLYGLDCWIYGSLKLKSFFIFWPISLYFPLLKQQKCRYLASHYTKKIKTARNWVTYEQILEKRIVELQHIKD